MQNRGGVVGAWLADLLLYLFGVSTWWWVIGGAVLVVAGYRRVVRPDDVTDHPLALGAFGFALVLLSSAALEAIRMWKLPASLPLAPGGALGDAIGQGLSRAIGFNGATLLLLALFAIGSSLLFGVSWLKVMERIGAGIEALIGWIRRRREAAVDRRIGDEATIEREHVVSQLREEEDEHIPVVVVPAVAYVPKSERVVKEKQRPLFTDMPDSPLPPLALLEDAPSTQESVGTETLEYTSRLIERKLADFGVSAKVLAAYPGPVITRYEIEPAVGVKGAQIVNLIKDIARALSVVSIRVVETIPGKSCMGLELPNPRRQVVKLVEILSSTTYNDTPGVLTLALGKDIAGKPVVADLARMPHLLVAGTTGSGKSVAVNAMILSLLYKAEPKQVRLILIDPEDARTVDVRGHPASARAGCHQHEAGPQRAQLVRRRNGAPLQADVAARRAQSRRLQRQDRRRPQVRQEGIESAVVDARDARAAGGNAADRRRGRRAGRPHDGDRQEDRGTDRAHRAESARGRHPPDPRHPAPLGRRHHRPHQGQHSVAHCLPGREQDRLAHDPGPDGCGGAAGARRHAVHAAGNAAIRCACTARSCPTAKCIASSST